MSSRPKEGSVKTIAVASATRLCATTSGSLADAKNSCPADLLGGFSLSDPTTLPLADGLPSPVSIGVCSRPAKPESIRALFNKDGLIREVGGIMKKTQVWWASERDLVVDLVNSRTVVVECPLPLGDTKTTNVPKAAHEKKHKPSPMPLFVSQNTVHRGILTVHAVLWSIKPSSFRARTGCWSLRIALASTCRTRSRVTLKILPTSSSVYV